MFVRRKLATIAIALLAFLLFASSGASPAAAAATQSQNKTYKASIEKTYGITIKLEPFLANDAELQNRLLQTIDGELAKFPPGLVKEVTDYFRGKKISTVYYVRGFTEKDDTTYKGTFGITNATATITLRAGGGMIEEWAVSHETGHLIHEYLKRTTDAANMQKTWTAMNGKAAYSSNWPSYSLPEGAQQVFARDYGSASYSEDFATIVEYLISRPDDVRTALVESPNSPYARKIAYLTQLLDQKTKAIATGANPWKRAIPEKPSTSGAAAFEEAVGQRLIPRGEYTDDGVWLGYRTDFRGLYSSKISKIDFTLLLSAFVERRTGLTLGDYAKSVGKYTSWKTEGSISFDGEHTVVKEKTNYPFNDTTDYHAFHLYKLGVVDGVNDPTVKSSNYRRVDAIWIYELKGLSNRKFEPDRELSAAEAATMLKRAASMLELTTASLPAGAGSKDKLTYEQAYALILAVWNENLSSLPVPEPEIDAEDPFKDEEPVEDPVDDGVPTDI